MAAFNNLNYPCSKWSAGVATHVQDIRAKIGSLIGNPTCHMSDNILFSGTNSNGKHFERRVSGCEQCLGIVTVPVDVEPFNMANFFFPDEENNLWKSSKPNSTDVECNDIAGENIAEQVMTFCDANKLIEKAKGYEYFYPPVDLTKGARGDLPNVTFLSILYLYVHKKGKIIIVDPVDKTSGTDLRMITSFIANMPQTVQWTEMQSNKKKPLHIVNYQSQMCGARSDEQDRLIPDAMYASGKIVPRKPGHMYIGDDSPYELLNVMLAPGKYEDGIKDVARVRQEYRDSVAKLFLNIQSYRVLVEALGFTCVASLNIRLDIYSGYSFQMVAAIMGLLGENAFDLVYLLCRRGDNMTRVPIVPEKFKEQFREQLKELSKDISISPEDEMDELSHGVGSMHLSYVSALKEKQPFCPQCGTKSPAISPRFCMDCGTPFPKV